MAKGPVIAITLTADDKTQKGFRSATANVEGFGSKVGAGAVAIGTFAGNLAADLAPKVIDFGKELFGLGSSVEVMGKKADTVFGDQVGSIRRWADANNEALGLSDERLVGLAASMGDLLVPMGFTRDAAAGLTTETLDAAGALAAWSGGQYDAAQVSEILTKAMLGERDQLKGLGISINQAEVDQRAMTIAQAEGRDEITAMDKALATQQLILEKSTDAQAAWADGTMDNVKAQAELSAMVDDAKVALAEKLVPAVQRVVRYIARDLVPWVKNAVRTFRENWPQIRAAVEPTIAWFRDTIADVVTVVSALWDTFGGDIVRYTKTAFGAIKTVVEGVLQAVRGIIDTVLGVLTGDWAKAWAGIRGIFKGVWKAIRGIVKLALAAVKLQMTVTWKVITKLLSKAWDGIRRLLSKAWDGIRRTVSRGASAVVSYVRGLPGRIWAALRSAPSKLVGRGQEFVRGLRDGIVSVWSNVLRPWFAEVPTRLFDALRSAPSRLVGRGREFLRGLREGIVSVWSNVLRPWFAEVPSRLFDMLRSAPTKLVGRGREFLRGLREGIVSVWDTGVKPFVAGLPGSLVNAVGYLGGVLYQAGRDLVQGFMNGIGSMAGAVADKARSVIVDAPKNLVKGALKIFSPSKVFEGYGANVVAGFAQGITRTADDVHMAVGAMIPQPDTEIIGPRAATPTAAGGNLIQHFPAGTRPEDVVSAQRRWQRRNGAAA